MTEPDDEERDLRIRLMTAQIENLKADTSYKAKLAAWEPWKAMATAAGAGAAFATAVLALGIAIGHWLG
jgi:hypothetical protein